MSQKINGYLILRQDVTEMVYKARYCQITTLRSKENLKSYLDKNKDSIFIGALINIDDFGTVNEIYGGEVGNTLLKIFAKRLS